MGGVANTVDDIFFPNSGGGASTPQGSSSTNLNNIAQLAGGITGEPVITGGPSPYFGPASAGLNYNEGNPAGYIQSFNPLTGTYGGSGANVLPGGGGFSDAILNNDLSGNGTTGGTLPYSDQSSSGPLATSNINFSYPGMPTTFPASALTQGYQNIQNLYGAMGNIAPQYYGQAIGSTLGTENQGLGQINNVYGTGLGTQQQLTQGLLPEAGSLSNQSQGQISGLENQNLSQVNNLLNNYDQNFVQQLGPSGQLGQQLMGEFDNYGLTPSSGAFQSALGNQLGSLGAQNALTLGQQALQPGINAQYSTLGTGLESQENLLGQGLAGQLATAQQGTQQGGQLANLGALQNMTLASQGSLSPLNYQDQAAQTQAGIINQASELPIDYFGAQNNMNFAQGLANQNQAAQNNAAQMGLYGSLGSAALLAAAK